MDVRIAKTARIVVEGEEIELLLAALATAQSDMDVPPKVRTFTGRLYVAMTREVDE